VFPLAAIVGAPACDKDPISSTTTNIDGVMEVSHRWIGRTERTRYARVIFPNTNCGYGIGPEGAYCTEDSPLNPISLYGRQKVKAEGLVLKFSNAIVLRLATVFGVSPRMRIDLMVNDFVYRAVNDQYLVLFEANFKRNYIHVRDVARVFMHCMANFEIMKNQVYNVGLSDANLSKLELCQEIKKQVPGFYFHEAEIGQDPDKRDYIVSSQKLENTGFKPQHSLPDGIAELIKGYQIVRNNKYTNI
jgi:nucleoside-diphosphate-sugar epimerase